MGARTDRPPEAGGIFVENQVEAQVGADAGKSPAAQAERGTLIGEGRGDIVKILLDGEDGQDE